MRNNTHINSDAGGPPELAARVTFVLICLASIAAGTIMAVASTPDNLSVATALFIPTVYMAIGVLMPVIVQLRTSLAAILRVENALMIGIIYWLLLDMLQSAYAFEVAPEHVQMAFVMVGGFAAALWLGASIHAWRLPRIVVKTASREFSTKALFRAIVIAFLLGMVKFAIPCNFNPLCMIEGLNASRWDAPWARGDLGGADAFLDHMQYFGYILPSLCVLILIRVGLLDWRVVTGLILSAILTAFLAQGGGRRIIGVIGGAALYTWVVSKPRLGTNVLLWGAASVTALLMAMQLMLYYRDAGLEALSSGRGGGADLNYLHVDDNFLRLAQLISFYPDSLDYVLHQPLFHALTLPIPRILWPGKPLGPGFDLPELLGKTGVSLTSSIIGELYVSFGIWAVLAGGWVLGRICGMWNRILQLPSGASRPLMYGLGLMALFAGLRSMQALVQMSYIVLAWMAVTQFLPRSRVDPSTK